MHSILVLGGARSGKSSFAEAYLQQHFKDVTYLATAQALDHEMAARIERHRSSRPSSWQTVEAPKDLASALKEIKTSAVLLDCLTLWTSNWVLSESEDDPIWAAFEAFCAQASTFEGTLLMVSNEVGLGLVPPDPVSRRFRDLAGLINQKAAAFADEVFLITAGISQKLK